MNQKKKNWIYSDDIELTEEIYFLPQFWWAAGVHGRSLSRLYEKLGREDEETHSGLSMTFYRHFIGSLFATAYELALKALLIGLDDPDGRRFGFPRTHDLVKLWNLVDVEVANQIEKEVKSRVDIENLSKWFEEHSSFLRAVDRYTEEEINNQNPSKTNVIHELLQPGDNKAFSKMECVWNSILDKIEQIYFFERGSESDRKAIEPLHHVFNRFRDLQYSRNQWYHLWGVPVVRPSENEDPGSKILKDGTLLGYALDVTLLEQGYLATPRNVPLLWWVPKSLTDIREFTDENEFNAFIEQRIAADKREC